MPRHCIFLDLNGGAVRRSALEQPLLISHFSFAAAPQWHDTPVAILASMLVPDTCPDVCEHLEQTTTRVFLPQD
jgi:hypothetical protein